MVLLVYSRGSDQTRWVAASVANRQAPRRQWRQAMAISPPPPTRPSRPYPTTSSLLTSSKILSILLILQKNSSLSESQLIEATSLRPFELHVAVGWLARENKIKKEGEIYKLDETNLTDEIGTNAGKIWHLLCQEGESDVENISKLTRIEDKDAYSALGWLAREDKIELRSEKKKDI